MGIYENLTDALFSRVQARVLGILFVQPDQEFQLSEIIASAKSGRGAVQRELQKLAAVGIVSTIVHGNRKLYRANRESPVFEELHQLILKTVGLIDPLRNALSAYRSFVTSAFVYGSVAKRKDKASSDIDVMIIGEDLSYSEIYGALQRAEAVLARPVNPTLMSSADWVKKLKRKNAFVTKLLEQPKLFILGSEVELKALR